MAAATAVAGTLPSAVTPEPRLISEAGRSLIISFEVGSPAYYTRHYLRPVCPVCDQTASGVTIGIGYDLGYYSRSAVLADWKAHPQVHDLLPAVGLTRAEAQRAVSKLQHILTPYELAEEVFDQTTVVTYYRVAARAFGQPFLDAPEDVRAVLVSLVVNRGGSLGVARRGDENLPAYSRDSRWEMRQIARVYLPQRDYRGVAEMIRQMKRLWPNVRGLRDRREREAQFLERSL